MFEGSSGVRTSNLSEMDEKHVALNQKFGMLNKGSQIVLWHYSSLNFNNQKKDQGTISIIEDFEKPMLLKSPTIFLGTEFLEILSCVQRA